MSNKLNLDYFPTGPNGKTVLVSVLVVLFLILLCAWIYSPAFAEDDVTSKTFLPLVLHTAPEESFRIVSVDCRYIIAAWTNPSIELRKTNYTGYATVDRYPAGVPWDFPSTHWWYTYSDPARGLEIVYFYSQYPFAQGFMYYIGFNVTGANGGRFAVENDGDLWYPCPPH